jgi:hypothetical protein
VTTNNCHVDIPEPLDLLVKKQFLNSKDGAGYEPCTAFAVSVYKGHFPTLKILVNSTGALFDYVGLDVLAWNKDCQELFSVPELYSITSPSQQGVVVVHHKFLKDKNFKVWMNHKTKQETGKILFTVDWTEDNENLNLVALRMGQLAFVANHKMVCYQPGRGVSFLENLQLPPYQKNRKNYKP